MADHDDFAPLCGSCSRINGFAHFTQLCTEDGLHLQTSHRQFAQAISQGCPICSLLAKTSGLHPSRGTKASKALERIAAGKQAEPHELQVHLRLRIGNEPFVQYSGSQRRDKYKTIGETLEASLATLQVRGQAILHVAAEADNAAADVVLTRPVRRSVASDSSLDLARNWIDDCLSSHSSCPKPMRNFAPPRLLDVSKRKRGVRLSVDHDDSVDYVALSYCWGGTQSYTLTQKTIEDLRGGIDDDRLPRLLRDAISFTRRLGVKYIWIDALCIMQDSSKEQRAKEIGTMHQIYQGAYVTLLAASAAGSDESFLHERPAAWLSHPSHGLPIVKAAKIQVQRESGLPWTLLLQPNSMYVWWREPLHKRGWALQERLLSPRCLIFNTWQLQWSCKQTDDCNGGSVDLIYSPLPQKLTVDPVLNIQGFFPLNVINRAQAHQDWRRLVQNYSFLDVTEPQDRLPALSGLANVFADALQDDYIAGFWRDDLIYCLAWIRVPVGQEGGRSAVAEYIAPSWSWASKQIGLHWPDRNISLPFTQHTKLVEAYVQPRLKNAPFGAVSDGWLRLRVLTRRLTWGELWSFDKASRTHTEDKSGWTGLELYVDGLKKKTYAKNQRGHAAKAASLVASGSAHPLQLICFPLMDQAALVVMTFPCGCMKRFGVLRFVGDRFEEIAFRFWADCATEELTLY